MVPASHKTTWTMDQKDVNLVSLAKQYTSFAFQVDNPTTWIIQDPEQEIDLTLVPEYGVYVSPVVDLKRYSVLSTISRFFPIALNSSYSWTGSNLVDLHTPLEDAASIVITNNGLDACTFGLTTSRSNADDRGAVAAAAAVQMSHPICATVLWPKEETTDLQPQSKKFTPSLNLHVKIGRDQQAAGLITNIGTWTNFELTGISSKYVYDSTNSVWAKVP